MENGVKVLSEYRFERAKEMLDAATQNLNINQYRTSLNRSYYAVFHAMRAVNILNGYDSSKHSGVIAYFNSRSSRNERSVLCHLRALASQSADALRSHRLSTHLLSQFL